MGSTMTKNTTFSASGADLAADNKAPRVSQVMAVVAGDRSFAFDERLHDERWRHQLGIALDEAGIVMTPVTASPREVLRQAAPGATYVSVSAADSGQLRAVVVRPKDKRADVTMIGTTTTQTRKMSASSLAMLFGGGDRGAVEWGLVSDARPLESLRTPAGKQPDPIFRLRELLKLEGPTIRAVLVYALFVGVLALATPLAVQSVVNTIAFGTLLQPLVVLTILLFVGLLIAGGLRLLETIVVEVTQRRLFARAASDISHRLPVVAPQVAHRQDLRELVNRFLDIATLQKVSASLLLEGVGLAIQTVVGLLVLAFYHPLLLAFDVVLVAILYIVLRHVGHGAVKTALKESKSKYAVLAWFEQMAAQLPLFSSRQRTAIAVEQADRLTNQYLDYREAHFSRVLRQISSLVLLQAIASAALLGLGGWLVMIGELTLGQLVAAELILAAVVASLAKFGKHLEQFYDAAASVDKLGQLVDLPLQQTADRHVDLPDRAPLSLRDASLGYLPGKSVLREVNIDLAPGEQIAVVGPSGSGKSLLLQTLAGNLDLHAGDARLGRESLRRLPLSTVRSAIRHVDRAALLPGTLLDNVRVFDKAIPESEVQALMEKLGALPLLESLSDGLQTEICGDDALMPHDLRVQIALARELIACMHGSSASAHAPFVVLIDGLLDSVSSTTRQATMKLFAESSLCTVIATHHPEVIKASGRSLQLFNGHIEEIGR
jgi:putative ABC transport system ATP-binding protein